MNQLLQFPSSRLTGTIIIAKKETFTVYKAERGMLVQGSFDRAILGAGYQVSLETPCLLVFRFL